MKNRRVDVAMIHEKKGDQTTTKAAYRLLHKKMATNYLIAHPSCWKYFTCEIRSHIDKIVGCRLAYILVELILLPPYGFGKQ